MFAAYLRLLVNNGSASREGASCTRRTARSQSDMRCKITGTQPLVVIRAAVFVIRAVVKMCMVVNAASRSVAPWNVYAIPRLRKEALKNARLPIH